MFFNRDNAKRLVYENDMLQMQMSSTERDTLDVISYLKQEDGKKDEQVHRIGYKMSNYMHMHTGIYVHSSSLIKDIFCYGRFPSFSKLSKR